MIRPAGPVHGPARQCAPLAQQAAIGLAVLGLVFGATADAAAQFTPPTRPRVADPLSVFFRNAQLELVPAFGVADGHMEMEMRGILSLESDPSRNAAWGARTMAIGVRAPARTFAGAEVAVRGSVRHGRVRSSLEAAGFGGAGDATPAFGITAAIGTGEVTLVLRSTWLDRDPAQDSIAHGSGRPSGTLRLSETAAARHDEAELTATRRLGPVEATGNMGVRFGESRESTPPWAALQLAVPVRGNIDMYLAGGRRPERPEIGQLPGTFLMMGVRLRAQRATGLGGTPAPPPAAKEPFASYRVRDEAWVLVVHAPDARTVDLAGDFTDWEPVTLQATPGERGMWRQTFRVRPGLHQIAMRIDGGRWIAPPGLPVVPDGFGGEAGLLELR